MTKLKFRDEQDNFIPVVQDVKVNGESVFNGKTANIDMLDIPQLPILTKNRIYSLKLIDGVLQWFEETNFEADDAYIIGTTLMFSPASGSFVEGHLLTMSDISCAGVSDSHTLILN